MSRHLMQVILVEIEFLRDLLIGEIESHQIQTENPFPQRLMVMSEDGVGQIVKVAPTRVAMVALALALAFIAPAFDHPH